MKLGLSYMYMWMYVEELTRQRNVEDSRKLKMQTYPEHLSQMQLVASSLSLDLHLHRQRTASSPQLYSITDDSTFHTHRHNM